MTVSLRELKTKAIIEHDYEEICFDHMVCDGWIKHTLRHGIKGLDDLTDDEINRRYEEIKDGN